MNTYAHRSTLLINITIIALLLLLAPAAASAHDIGKILPHPTGTCPADFDATQKPGNSEWGNKFCNIKNEPGLGFCHRKVAVDGGDTFVQTNVECNYSLCDGVQIFANVARWILGFVGGLALLMFVIGGFQLIRSKGESGSETNAGGLVKAKKSLVAAVIGLVIVLAAWQIMNAVIFTVAGTPDAGGVAQILGKSWSNICTGQ